MKNRKLKMKNVVAKLALLNKVIWRYGDKITSKKVERLKEKTPYLISPLRGGEIERGIQIRN